MQQWDSRCAFSLLDTPTNGESDAFGQRLNTNAAVLPNYLTRSCRRKLDSKASKCGA